MCLSHLIANYEGRDRICFTDYEIFRDNVSYIVDTPFPIFF